jgi:hypothetical protein
MNPFFSISSTHLKIILLACYLFSAVFGIGVHAHEILSHHHDEIDEHVHHFVLHAHDDLRSANASSAIVAGDNPHDHDVPTLQISGVNNLRPGQEYSTATPVIVNLGAEMVDKHRDDYIIATILPNASPPLQSHLRSNRIGRAPPAA